MSKFLAIKKVPEAVSRGDSLNYENYVFQQLVEECGLSKIDVKDKSSCRGMVYMTHKFFTYSF
jgi:hypothetical protein